MKRHLRFDKIERQRLAKVSQVLGISFEEFAHDAIMQAADEVLGINDEVYRNQRASQSNTVTQEQIDELRAYWAE